MNEGHANVLLTSNCGVACLGGPSLVVNEFLLTIKLTVYLSCPDNINMQYLQLQYYEITAWD
jgi:hypothetical protein